jgi:hypothetical protein
MTRFLSESLQAPEPSFSLGLKRLEAANGNPSADIRFTTEVNHDTRQKLQQLGLDPKDTTAEELYHVLQQRVQADDISLTRTLRTVAASHVSAEADVADGIIRTLEDLPDSRRCFALKNTVAKSIIKQLPPKKAMKVLGYRSLDSMLKHEQPVYIMAAAWLAEGSSWQHKLLDRYKKLTTADFEQRNIQLLSLRNARWRKLADSVVEDRRHNLLALREMGALLFLPLPNDVAPGTVTASLSLALHEINEIRAASTLLKLSQVKKDFGGVVQMIVRDEPGFQSNLLDQTVPWHLIQRYYARIGDKIKEDMFEPYIELEDMAWQSVERTLSNIEPGLAFWHNSGHLGLLHQGKLVSLNIVDAALNCCNQLQFDQRMVQHFQRSLWHELLLRYLKRDTVEQVISGELQPELVKETVTA